MIKRTTNPKHKQYANYGGAGITVCERWRDFAAFLEDMGERPDGLSIDRIDNTKGYAPDNCRWATRRQQRCNTSRNIIIDCFGEMLTRDEIAERYGLCANTLKYRLSKGWTLERAVQKTDNRAGGMSARWQ